MERLAFQNLKQMIGSFRDGFSGLSRNGPLVDHPSSTISRRGLLIFCCRDLAHAYAKTLRHENTKQLIRQILELEKKIIVRE